MRKQLGIVLGTALCLALTAPPAWAADAPRMSVTTSSVEQKMDYFHKLVEKGVAAKLISGSGNEKDKQVLAEARTLVDEASDDLAAGNNDIANEKLNKALGMITGIARSLVGGDAKKKRQAEAYESRKQTISSFVSAYERIAAEKDIGSKATANVRKVQAYIDDADKKLSAGDAKAARDNLDIAYLLITGYTAEIRQGETLVRELKFETPADEYHYEVDRNDSLFAILELTLKEKPQNEKFKPQIDAMRVDAEQDRIKAEQQAGTGKYVNGMDFLAKSNKTLIKAIRMAGLFIPG